MNRIVVNVNNINSVMKALKGLKGGEAGYLKETTGPTKPYGEDLTLASNAMKQEFGDKKIPPRPFMRGGAERFEKSKSKVGKVLANALELNIGPNSANEKLGSMMKSDIQGSIRGGKFAKLSPYTIAKKGSSKPLIDQGHLIQGVDGRGK